MANWSSLPKATLTVFNEHISDADQLSTLLEPFNVVCVMRERTPITAELLRRLPNLRLLVTTGMYNAAIDLGTARERGVTVCGTDSQVAPTVELTWALILAAARQVCANDRAMREHGWQRHLGFGLRGRQLGVIGLGRNGAGVAAIGRAFGMNVAAWSQNLTRERAAELDVHYLTKDELLESSDILTIHLRLSERTVGLIGSQELQLMRTNAILVNTSRGPIIEESALVHALRTHSLRAAALDVYDVEPLPADHPFRSLDNVVLSPHVGYVTEENMRRYYSQTVEDVAAFSAGEPIRLL